MKTPDEIMDEAQAAYEDGLRQWVTRILVAYNEYIESSCLDEFERSGDWMIRENIIHFLETHKELWR